jgi:hypothetical protein
MIVERSGSKVLLNPRLRPKPQDARTPVRGPRACLTLTLQGARLPLKTESVFECVTADARGASREPHTLTRDERPTRADGRGYLPSK